MNLKWFKPNCYKGGFYLGVNGAVTQGNRRRRTFPRVLPLRDRADWHSPPDWSWPTPAAEEQQDIRDVARQRRSAPAVRPLVPACNDGRWRPLCISHSGAGNFSPPQTIRPEHRRRSWRQEPSDLCSSQRDGQMRRSQPEAPSHTWTLFPSQATPDVHSTPIRTIT